MTMTQYKSPLGSTSSLYRVKSNERGSILDSPDKGTLEVYPAGYTHTSNINDKSSRQIVYKKIYEECVAKETEGSLYPLGKEGHYIKLIPNPTNKHDANAIHMILRTKPGSPLSELDGRDLGFIPKKINKQILKNLAYINSGKILKVKANFHKKYYTAKIILGYGDNTFSNLDKSTLTRFGSIIFE